MTVPILMNLDWAASVYGSEEVVYMFWFYQGKIGEHYA